jgi:hypothetical protein
VRSGFPSGIAKEQSLFGMADGLLQNVRLGQGNRHAFATVRNETGNGEFNP